VPVFVVVYFSDDTDRKYYAVLVYAIAAFSDFLDGFFARRFEASSNLGKLLDPLGDKLMTFAVMVCITIDRPILLWAALAFFVKEVLLGIGGLLLHKKAHAELIKSNILGKATTVVFFVVFVVLMLFQRIPDSAATVMVSIAIGLTFLALISYVKIYISLMRNRDKIGDEAEER